MSRSFRHMVLMMVGVFLCGVPIDRTAAEEWSQWRGPGREGRWLERGVVERFDEERIPLKWSVEVGAGYSGPTVAAGRVYLMDRVEEPAPRERILCFDAETGERVWTRAYEEAYGEIGYQAGPRASVLIDGGRAYGLGATGRLHCLDAETGEVIWASDLQQRYNIDMPNWGTAAAPIVEGGLLIMQIGGEDACIVALNKKTGEEAWTALSDPASYAAPIVIDQAGRRVLICFTADRLVGLDPASGKLHWEYAMPRSRWPIAIATPVVHRGFLFATSIYEGSVLLRLREDEPAVEEVWRRETSPSRATHGGLNGLISTPLLRGEHIYGVHARGQLRCLELTTGELVWESTTPVEPAQYATVHLIGRGGGEPIWLFNEDGELIIARLTPEGYEEVDRAKLIEPTRKQNPGRRGGVVWSHPAFANRHVFARNDKRLVCADLSAEGGNAR